MAPQRQQQDGKCRYNKYKYVSGEWGLGIDLYPYMPILRVARALYESVHGTMYYMGYRFPKGKGQFLEIFSTPVAVASL